mmetsp:Transcript_88134/g.152657  ORF Transcript_88134/g.152657 Transcript_88134/m.152657 type:complete len:284 (-) Transcript_88134:228-1079(-)
MTLNCLISIAGRLLLAALPEGRAPSGGSSWPRLVSSARASSSNFPLILILSDFNLPLTEALSAIMLLWAFIFSASGAFVSRRFSKIPLCSNTCSTSGTCGVVSRFLFAPVEVANSKAIKRWKHEFCSFSRSCATPDRKASSKLFPSCMRSRTVCFALPKAMRASRASSRFVTKLLRQTPWKTIFPWYDPFLVRARPGTAPADFLSVLPDCSALEPSSVEPDCRYRMSTHKFSLVTNLISGGHERSLKEQKASHNISGAPVFCSTSPASGASAASPSVLKACPS